MIANSLKALPVMILMVMVPMTAFAQTDPALDAEAATVVTETRTPLDAVARLSPLLGNFTVSGTQNEADGSVTTYLPTAAVGLTIVNGVGVEQIVRIDAGVGQPITNRITFGYDQYRQLYRVTVLDDMSGLLDVFEGDFGNDNVLSVTNLRADTFYPVGEQAVYFKLEWDLSGDAPTFDVMASVDAGETWMPYMQTVLSPDA